MVEVMVRFLCERERERERVFLPYHCQHPKGHMNYSTISEKFISFLSITYHKTLSGISSSSQFIHLISLS